MNLTFNWYDNSNQVIVIRIQNAWTWDEFLALYEEYRPMIIQQSHKVCTIFDVRRDPMPPADFLTRLPYLWRAMPDNLGIVIVIGAVPATRILWRIVTRVYAKIIPMPITFETTFEDAYANIVSWQNQQE